MRRAGLTRRRDVDPQAFRVRVVKDFRAFLLRGNLVTHGRRRSSSASRSPSVAHGARRRPDHAAHRRDRWEPRLLRRSTSRVNHAIFLCGSFLNALIYVRRRRGSPLLPRRQARRTRSWTGRRPSRRSTRPSSSARTASARSRSRRASARSARVTSAASAASTVRPMAEIDGQVKEEELDAEQQARRRLALAQIRQYPDAALKMAAPPGRGVRRRSPPARRPDEAADDRRERDRARGDPGRRPAAAVRLPGVRGRDRRAREPGDRRAQRGDDGRRRGLPFDPGRAAPGRAADDDRDRRAATSTGPRSATSSRSRTRASPSTSPTTSTAS